MSKRVAVLVISSIIGLCIVLNLWALNNFEIEFQFRFLFTEYLPGNWLWLLVTGVVFWVFFFSPNLYKYLIGQRRKFRKDKQVTKVRKQIRISRKMILLKLVTLLIFSPFWIFRLRKLVLEPTIKNGISFFILGSWVFIDLFDLSSRSIFWRNISSFLFLLFIFSLLIH